jgi:hypothetical protein
MSKAREIAELGQKLTVDASGNIDVDGSVTSNTLSVDSNITVGGTVDGRDIAADGAVIDGLGTAATAASTDFVAVTGDTMTGDLTVPNVIVSGNVDGRDVSADGTKLDGIEPSADVTDTANVTAAGALMDSEVTNLAQVKAFNATDYATSAQGTLAASAVQPNDSAALKELDLNAIASTIADTAVDVFVYDTSKDSDGGAWRKRTQGTSWYNETLNTATRGTRKEFPAVAVIVAEADTVTIYDGDDPDLPMWMVFNGTNDYGSYLGRTSGANVTAVHMLNGILCVSRGNSGFGEALLRSDFIKEFSVNYAGSGWLQLLPISGRNEGANYNVQLNYTGINPIVNIAVNDVAMTVLPNAPIDAATGLPVPTIAVGTDGGTSVIRDDGTVVDIKYTWTTVATKSVSFTEANEIAMLMYGTASGGGTGLLVGPIPSSDAVASSDLSSYFTEYRNNGTLPFCNSGDQWKEALAYTDDNLAIAFNGTGKMLRVIRENQEAPSDGLVLFITSTYNTGWQNGAIKLATLSDTDDTDVTGAELVTNGTFDSDTSGWTGGNGATLSVVSGALRVTNDGSTSYPFAVQVITTEVGKTYTVSARALTSPSYNWYIEVVGGGGSVQQLTEYQEHTFTATGTAAQIRVIHRGPANGNYKDFDNISVRLAEEDRSVNGNGLQVFGTVTKNPVATGADLVSYGGMSSSDNRLMQPYNSDLDFGTGDYSIIAWIKDTDWGGTNNYIMDRGKTDQSSTGRSYLTISSSGYLVMKNASGSEVHANSREVPTNTWVCVVVSRQSGTLSFAINGEIIYTDSSSNSSASFDAGAGSQWTTVGSYPYATNYDVAEIALVRISATAPSPEQIKKIYEDEKVLFQENAQATLYGSSDAVTALAYDDTTELLHVGTSAGRSVFQGLRRVDNTTDAVGAAISASNGLVAED